MTTRRTNKIHAMSLLLFTVLVAIGACLGAAGYRRCLRRQLRQRHAAAERHSASPKTDYRKYLEQVMQQLVRAGILKGVRGPRGGYRLAKGRCASRLVVFWSR